MRCSQELYGHINCDRDVILGEKYCKFHFVPSLRVEIEKLQAENAKLRAVVMLASEACCYTDYEDACSLASKVLKELEEK